MQIAYILVSHDEMYCSFDNKKTFIPIRAGSFIANTSHIYFANNSAYFNVVFVVLSFTTTMATHTGHVPLPITPPHPSFFPCDIGVLNNSQNCFVASHLVHKFFCNSACARVRDICYQFIFKYTPSIMSPNI